MNTADASTELAISHGGDTRRAYQGWDDGGELSQSYHNYGDPWKEQRYEGD